MEPVQVISIACRPVEGLEDSTELRGCMVVLKGELNEVVMNTTICICSRYTRIFVASVPHLR